ncbi:hypothetical protein A7982_13579 [Minicystis rosea]|nr:hypothetical protein A7982_13579 [Minicystis rosea]
MSQYVSPMMRARAINSGLEKNASEKEREVAARMVRLPAMVLLDLERAEAPKFVFRWVAWAANHTMQRRRTDLVLYLRRSIERRLNGWFEERHLTAAMAALEAARDEARRRGGIMPAVDQIPVEVYRAAVEGAAKNKRQRRLEPELEAAIEQDEPLSSDDEDDGAHGGGGDDNSGEDDEHEAVPISERILRGRGRILRRLSDAVGEALAVQDVEAAEAINNTIALLCGSGDIGLDVAGPVDGVEQAHEPLDERRRIIAKHRRACELGHRVRFRDARY